MPPRAYSRRGRRSGLSRGAHQTRQASDITWCAAVARGRVDRDHPACAPAGRAIYRSADRARQHLRRSGGDRDREHAAADRATGGAGTADRDRRGVAGDQRVARQSDASFRCDAGKSNTPLRCPLASWCTYDGECFQRTSRCWGFPVSWRHVNAVRPLRPTPGITLLSRRSRRAMSSHRGHYGRPMLSGAIRTCAQSLVCAVRALSFW